MDRCGWRATRAGLGGSLLRLDRRDLRPLSRRRRLAGATCIAVGAGAVWVTSAERGLLFRIDPVGAGVRPLRAGRYPEGVAVGFGSVWVASGQQPCGSRSRPCTATTDTSGQLVRLDPASNRTVARLRIASSPSYVAIGAGGVWVSSNDGTIALVDPATNRLRRRIQVTGGGRTTLAAGRGSLWVTSIHGPGAAGELVRVDPRSGRILRSFRVGESPVGMAFGYGSLWVANFNDGSVSRIRA